MEFRLELCGRYLKYTFLFWLHRQRGTISSSMIYSDKLEFGIGREEMYFNSPGNHEFSTEYDECGRTLSVLLL